VITRTRAIHVMSTRRLQQIAVFSDVATKTTNSLPYPLVWSVCKSKSMSAHPAAYPPGWNGYAAYPPQGFHGYAQQPPPFAQQPPFAQYPAPQGVGGYPKQPQPQQQQPPQPPDTLKQQQTQLVRIAMIVVVVLLAIGLAVLLGAIISNYIILPRVSSDCAWGEWSQWQGCTPNACAGVATRTRVIKAQAKGAGRACVAGEMVESMPCNQLSACHDLDCGYGSWETEAECDPNACVDASGGCNLSVTQRVESRQILRDARPGGKPCAYLEMVRTTPCNALGECPQPTDCIPGVWSEIIGCPPDDGTVCRLPGEPPIVGVQTRASTPAANGGTPCPASLMTRPVDCGTPVCQACEVEYGTPLRCDKPCGGGVQITPGDIISGGDNSAYVCAGAKVSACNTGACPTGAFDSVTGTCSWSSNVTTEPCGGVPMDTHTAQSIIAMYNSGTSPQVSQQVAESLTSDITTTIPSNVLDFCLMQCAETASCVGVEWDLTSSAGHMVLALGDAPTATCPQIVGSFTQTTYVWDDASTNCAPPNNAMVDAACMDMCAIQGALPPGSSHAALPARGLFYPLGGGSLSCPVTAELMAASGTCGLGTDGAWTCPLSQDCVYEPWAEAGVWSTCDGHCGGPAGTRRRARAIRADAAFGGDPCTLAGIAAQVPCNQTGSISDAPNMGCWDTTNNTSQVAAVNCSDLCATTAGCLSVTQVNAPAALNVSAAAGQEPMFVTFDATTSAGGRASADAAVAAAGWRYATLDEIAGAAAAGAGWCAPGYFHGSGAATAFPAPSVAFSAACSRRLGGPSALPPTAAPNGLASRVVVWEPEDILAHNVVPGAVVVALRPPAPAAGAQPPLPTNMATLTPWRQTYLWDDHAMQATWAMPPNAPAKAAFAAGGNYTCWLHGATIDTMLQAGACFGTEAADVYDSGCPASEGCQVSDWTEVEACPSCAAAGTKQYSLLSREVLRQAQHGGIPCDRYPLTKHEECKGLPECPEGVPCVLGEWATTQDPSILSVCSARVNTPILYQNAWPVAVQSAFIEDGRFSTLTDGSPLALGGGSGVAAGDDVWQWAAALNASCLNTDGSAPTCLWTNQTTDETTWEWVDGSGWNKHTCTPDPGWKSCFQRMMAAAPQPVGVLTLVGDGRTTWRCPSLCQWFNDLCAADPCPINCCATSSCSDAMTAVRRPILQDAGSNSGYACNLADTLMDVPCAGAGSSLPACNRACPVASASGKVCNGLPNTCNTLQGVCECNGTTGGPACDEFCPSWVDGSQCGSLSGNGTCGSNTGRCTCNPGFGGPNCAPLTNLLLGNSRVMNSLRDLLVRGAVTGWDAIDHINACDGRDSNPTTGCDICVPMDLASSPASGFLPTRFFSIQHGHAGDNAEPQVMCRQALPGAVPRTLTFTPAGASAPVSYTYYGK